MNKPRVATVWLEGCSGCHMSIFDMDERLLELGSKVNMVHTPLVDSKEYPDNVDIVLIEGGIGSEDDRKKAHIIRERTRTVISLGDCAVTGNIVVYRNPFKVEDVVKRVYLETADAASEKLPGPEVPKLLPYVVPVHEIIDVDIFIPGCPPSADMIYSVLMDLIEGREPIIESRFG